MNRILKEQRTFFLSNKTKDLKFRLQMIKKLNDLLLSNKDKFQKALYDDLGKSHHDSSLSELIPTQREFQTTYKKLAKWIKPKNVSTPIFLFPSCSKIIDEPYGNTLIISPWNYPYQLALIPLIASMAAGNTAILKPSELTPHTSGLIAELINNNFDSSYIYVSLGDAKVSQELLTQKFDFIFFTGSTSVGRVVAQAAAKNLTATCLELGGKSPTIVAESANIELAARRIISGKFLNAGQTCIAPDYVIAHDSIFDQLKLAFEKCISHFYYNGRELDSSFTKIINTHHYDRLSKLLEGHKILNEVFYNRENLIMSPTLVEVDSYNSALMRDEIFGPILPIIKFSDFSQLLSHLQSFDSKPLAAYLFTNNQSEKKAMTNNLSSGALVVNDTIMHFVNKNLPFGGVGESGQGKYHGYHSFKVFSHAKSVMNASSKSIFDFSLRYPPLNDFKEKIINLLWR